MEGTHDSPLSQSLVTIQECGKTDTRQPHSHIRCWLPTDRLPVWAFPYTPLSGWQKQKRGTQGAKSVKSRFTLPLVNLYTGCNILSTSAPLDMCRKQLNRIELVCQDNEWGRWDSYTLSWISLSRDFSGFRGFAQVNKKETFIKGRDFPVVWMFPFKTCLHLPSVVEFGKTSSNGAGFSLMQSVVPEENQPYCDYCTFLCYFLRLTLLCLEVK